MKVGTARANVEWQSAKDPQGYETNEFVVSGNESRKVTGCLWIPTGEIHANTLLACGHGASGDRYQMPIPHLARRMAKNGIATLSMDGPVHGLRQKSVGGREAFAEEMRQSDVVENMNADWQLAIEISESKLGFNVTRFGYYGLSMGSIFGIPFLSARTQQSLNVQAATLGLLGTSGAASSFSERLKTDAAKIIAPVFFVMQLDDELFPREGYLELFDSIGSSDKRLHANPGRHPAVPAEEIDFCFQFLYERLLEQE